MAGAHLDSVIAGPGINDNGSGSAALLEVAEQMAKVQPRNKVRFAWWGAEESRPGRLDRLRRRTSAQAERDRIALYLNFDMVGSPNYVFFIYDGDNSDDVGAGPGPAGSAQIEKTFERYYTSVGEPFKGTDFTGRSDYGPFIAVGIPVGWAVHRRRGHQDRRGSGDLGRHRRPAVRPVLPPRLRHVRQQQRLHALDVNSDAIAYATLQYAMNTSDVNGQRGKGNFQPPPPLEPAS